MKKKLMIAIVVLAIAVLAAGAAFGVFGTKDDVQQEPTIVQVETTDAPADTSAELADVQEEEVFEIAELYGTVTEIADEYVMLDTKEHGQVQVNLSDDTMTEGVESVEIGQVIKVIYDGKMTRSIPAQITAMLIGVYAVEGEVTEIGEGRITLMRSDTQEEVILSLPEGAEVPAVGDVVTAYTTGVSTMSLPPQMNAVAIAK